MKNTVDNVIECDGALILGAGIAGLFTALKLAPLPALVLAGSQPGATGSSAWAQGGIAAAVGEGDNWQSHAADTLAAGAGLCDPVIANLVAREAPDRIADLVAYGAPLNYFGSDRFKVTIARPQPRRNFRRVNPPDEANLLRREIHFASQCLQFGAHRTVAHQQQERVRILAGSTGEPANQFPKTLFP